MDDLTREEVLTLLISYSLSINNKREGYSYVNDNIIRAYKDDENHTLLYDLFKKNYLMNTGFKEFVDKYVSIIY